MANKHIGEVSLPVGGETYTMRMTIREMIKVEAHFGKSWNECVMSMTDNMKLVDMLHYIKAALSGAHPDLSDDDVCELVTEAGLSKVTLLNAGPDVIDCGDVPLKTNVPVPERNVPPVI